MKITIDTKEDSHDEIKKVISLLQTLLEVKETRSNIFEDTGSESSQSAGLFGMFQDKKEPESPSEPLKEPVSTEDLLKKAEKDDKDPEIIPY